MRGGGGASGVWQDEVVVIIYSICRERGEEQCRSANLVRKHQNREYGLLGKSPSDKIDVHAVE